MTGPDFVSCQFIVTAEHASAAIPPECQALLDAYLPHCETHQIFDPGARAIAEELASRLSCPLFCGAYTRLAVDLNRSIGNGAQFSPPLFEAPEALKAELLQKYYLPFRQDVLTAVREACERRKSVIHISIHSYTKRFRGQSRSVDCGVLFDATRNAESAMGRAWAKALQAVLPDFDVRCNQPYDGAEDGHTTALRRLFPESSYFGLEIELSQDLDLESDAESIAKILVTTLKKTLLKVAPTLAR